MIGRYQLRIEPKILDPEGVGFTAHNIKQIDFELYQGSSPSTDPTPSDPQVSTTINDTRSPFFGEFNVSVLGDGKYQAFVLDYRQAFKTGAGVNQRRWILQRVVAVGRIGQGSVSETGGR